MQRKTAIITAVICLALVAIGIYAWDEFHEQQVITTAVNANTKVMNSFIQDEGLDVDQRWKLIQEAKQANEGLSDNQRKQVERQAWEVMRGEFNRKVDAYLDLEDKNAKTEFIDRELDRWDNLQDDMQEIARREKASRGNRDETETNGRPRGGPPWARGGGSGMPSRERMQSILNRTTPNERAKFTEFMTAIIARKFQRDLLSK